jgi:hypothetical protein
LPCAWNVFALSEEHDLRVFENRVLRRIFWPKREVRESCTKFPDDRFNNLYASQNSIGVNKSKTIKWAGRVACMRQMIDAYKILAWKTEVMEPKHR